MDNRHTFTAAEAAAIAALRISGGEADLAGATRPHPSRSQIETRTARRLEAAGVLRIEHGRAFLNEAALNEPGGHR
jgi:hypothetical protein